MCEREHLSKTTCFNSHTSYPHRQEMCFVWLTIFSLFPSRVATMMMKHWKICICALRKTTTDREEESIVVGMCVCVKYSAAVFVRMWKRSVQDSCLWEAEQVTQSTLLLEPQQWKACLLGLSNKLDNSLLTLRCCYTFSRTINCATALPIPFLLVHALGAGAAHRGFFPRSHWGCNQCVIFRKRGTHSLFFCSKFVSRNFAPHVIYLVWEPHQMLSPTPLKRHF